MKQTNKFILAIVLFVIAFGANAQCKILNTSFKSGEHIHYDLYFSYGLINSKAGVGHMRTDMVDYKGASAYNIRMQMNTTGLVGSFYSVNDTLVSYIDMDLRPLLFTKNAYEGKDYSKEVQTFTYSDNGVKVRTNRVYNGQKRFDKTFITEHCTYDYLSVLPLIRNMDYTGMKVGDSKQIQFIAGKDIVNMSVNFGGKTKVKANNGKTYDAIQISLTIYDKAFKNQKEAISATLTDDGNRVPIIINTQLKVGSIRAVLSDVTGLRN